MEHRITFEDVHARIGKLFKEKGNVWSDTYLEGFAPFKRAVGMVVNKALRLEGRVLVKDQDYSDKHVADSVIDLCVWTLLTMHIGEVEKKRREAKKEDVSAIHE